MGARQEDSPAGLLVMWLAGDGRSDGHPGGLEEVERHLVLESPHDGHRSLTLMADVAGGTEEKERRRAKAVALALLPDEQQHAAPPGLIQNI